MYAFLHTWTHNGLLIESVMIKIKSWFLSGDIDLGQSTSIRFPLGIIIMLILHGTWSINVP